MRLAGARHSDRRRGRVACLVLGALWLCLGLGPGPAEAQERSPAQPGGVYRRPLGHDPSTLDPARGLAIVSEGLLTYFDEASVLGMWRRFARGNINDAASRKGLT